MPRIKLMFRQLFAPSLQNFWLLYIILFIYVSFVLTSYLLSSGIPPNVIILPCVV